MKSDNVATKKSDEVATNEKATRSRQWKSDEVVQTDYTRPCSRIAPQQPAHEHAIAVVDADRILELLEQFYICGCFVVFVLCLCVCLFVCLFVCLVVCLFVLLVFLFFLMFL